MKRCPKCSRTFPDENQKFCTVDGGLLIAAQPAFDPNVTIRATPSDMGSQHPNSENATSRELPNLDATMFEAAAAPTEVLTRNTGPTMAPTTGGIQQTPRAATAAPAAHTSAPLSPTHPQPAKKSKLPWILGGLAVFLLLGASAAAALFFFVIQPRLGEFSQHQQPAAGPPVAEQPAQPSNPETNRETTEPEVVPPYEPQPGMTKFANSKDDLDGQLAAHYLDFSFYYPESWQVDPKAGVRGAGNFARVMKMLDDETGEYLLESAAVRWYESSGTFDGDLPVFPKRAKDFSDQLAPAFPGYQKISEGPTQVNSLKAYEFRFGGVFKGTGKGDLPYWGRTVFIPAGVEGEKSGIVIVLLATSLASEVTSASDVGEKGDLRVILESFRFGKS